MSELEIPEASHFALAELRRDIAWKRDRSDVLSDVTRIQRIAGPVVAAELRRILDDYEVWELLEALHARITELDGGVS